jgi:hypothetical protein
MTQKKCKRRSKRHSKIKRKRSCKKHYYKQSGGILNKYDEQRLRNLLSNIGPEKSFNETEINEIINQLDNVTSSIDMFIDSLTSFVNRPDITKERIKNVINHTIRVLRGTNPVSTSKYSSSHL